MVLASKLITLPYISVNRLFFRLSLINQLVRNFDLRGIWGVTNIFISGTIFVICAKSLILTANTPFGLN